MFRVRTLTSAALALALMGVLVACQPASAPYVALGDSYTAGPLIPDQSLEPLGCLRSSHDWPAEVASQLGTTVRDVSCSGAETEDMAAPQGVTPGPNPAQLDSVTSATKVVTLQIGGNDIGFTSIVKNCARLNPFETGCKGDYVTPAGDALAAKVSATEPAVAGVIKAIHAKAPSAKVFVVGYPSILPNTGGGCWPSVPIIDSDVAYLRTVAKGLNSMIQHAATTNGATYIDIYTPSIGHDACSGSRWVEPVIPGTSAAPVHPNATGMKAIAAVIAPKVASALA